MKKINVASSSIKSIGYDYQSYELEIEFIRGAIYKYRNVSSLIVCQLIFADSVGKCFDQHIKNNYEYEKIN